MSLNPESESMEPSNSSAIAPAQEVEEDVTVMQLMRKLHGGQVTGKLLRPADRRACVAHLIGDGYTVAEIAEVLKLSERTIHRDRNDIYESYSLQNDPKTRDQLVGRLVQAADLASQKLRKVARDKATPAAVVVEALHRSYEIVSDLTIRLQSLGILPTASQQIYATLTHQSGDSPNYEMVEAEVKRIKSTVIEAAATNPELISKMKKLEETIECSKLLNQISAVEQDAQKGEVNAPAAN